jgi:hypothetical protein
VREQVAAPKAETQRTGVPDHAAKPAHALTTGGAVALQRQTGNRGLSRVLARLRYDAKPEVVDYKALDSTKLRDYEELLDTSDKTTVQARELQDMRERRTALGAHVPAPVVPVAIPPQSGHATKHFKENIKRLSVPDKQVEALAAATGGLDDDTLRNLDTALIQTDLVDAELTGLIDSLLAGKLANAGLKRFIGVLAGTGLKGKDLAAAVKSFVATGLTGDQLPGVLDAQLTGQTRDEILAAVTRLRAAHPPDRVTKLLLLGIKADDVEKLLGAGLSAAELENVGEAAAALVARYLNDGKYTHVQLSAILKQAHASSCRGGTLARAFLGAETYFGAPPTAVKFADFLREAKAQVADIDLAGSLLTDFKVAGHVDPGHTTNSFAAPLHVLNTFNYAQNACATRWGAHPAFRLDVVIPDGKVRHVLDGHVYRGFCFRSAPNCDRNSSMFEHPVQTAADVILKARDAVAATTPEMENAAFLDTPVAAAQYMGVLAHGQVPTQSKKANWTIAFSYSGQPGPNHYRVAVAQLYPDGAWKDVTMRKEEARSLRKMLG